ncbi:unnamed protein product [Sphagnum jensenii]|uniref:Uncharacterized protein n=1 Tax=Sphagnum jensenii TaxID=128206 RepID=A0ABP1BXT9_9BRYO
MEPLGLEGLLNTNLDIQVFTPIRGPNGFPGGHANFDRGHPGLEQDSFQRVLVVKVLAAPLRPEVVRRLPLFPYSDESFPSLLSRRTIHEAVLGGFRESSVATFAGGMDSHCLEPGAHWQAPVERQPNERADFA